MKRPEVYDLYWRFAAERQHIFFNRLERPATIPTQDQILREYKFTNAYRAADRTSQYLIKEVIYGERYSTDAEEVVFRILLFKLFNKISTWRLFEDALGSPAWRNFNHDAYDRILSAATSQGSRIYSAAYIIPPVSLDATKVKHRGHLKLLALIMQSGFVTKLQKTKGLADAFQLLKSYPSLGNFLAFQLAIDLNYSNVINHDEAAFVVAGPGAIDGLAKTFRDADGLSPERLIAIMMERQELEFDRLEIPFRSLWGRPLQLVDCQNVFCEISKYTRVSHPSILGHSGRTRIKQIYKSQGAPMQPWFPPKWGLNNKIPKYTLPIDSFQLPF